MSDQNTTPPTKDTPWQWQRINLPIAAGFLLTALSLVPDVAQYVLPFVPVGQRRDVVLAAVGVCGLIAARFGRTATQELANHTLPMVPVAHAAEAAANRAEARVERIVERASGFTADLPNTATSRPRGEGSG
jgi:hypothetical protein